MTKTHSKRVHLEALMATGAFQAMPCKSLLFEMKLVQHGAVAKNMATPHYTITLVCQHV